MRTAILALLLGAFFLAPAAAAPVPAGIETAAPFVEPPDLEERIRAITEAPAHPAVELYIQLLLAFTIVIAALILVSGIDDAFVDACYWLRGLRRRKVVIDTFPDSPQAPFALMVPAWKEHDVIAAMVENTVKTLDYEAYRIFCGVYRNDPATAHEVDRMAARYPDRVTRVDVPHDGPTCKADCLNQIVRRVLLEERSGGTRFAGMVLHDSEDVIHPLELSLFNSLVPANDLVQLPVFSLDRAWNDIVAGTYIDDFAESHGKDMAVREAVIGIVPGAGVATCYSRRCLAALWSASGGEPFNTASLTEDYDLSFRLARDGMRQTFAHVAVDTGQLRIVGVRGATGSVISTHEYFPDKFKAAYRQRARWVIGIAFQGWQHMGWRGTAWERYFLFRDRKAIVMAPACVAAYVLVLNFVLGMTFGPEELAIALQSFLSLPAFAAVLVLNFAFMANRALQRMYFVRRYYGRLQAMLSLVRMPVNNLINFFAVMRAWRLFLLHLITGKKLAWDKTAHVYPDAPVLAPAKAAGVAVMMFALLLAAQPDAMAAPPPLTGRAYQLADQAYKALEQGEHERAMRLASQALKLAPGHASLLALQADILARQGKHAEALERIRALGPEDLGSYGLAQRGYLWLELKNHAAAEADFAEAVRLGGLNAEGRGNVAAELAYLALRRNDDAAALRWFETAIAAGRASAGFYADAGYAAIRAFENRKAIDLLSRAVDEGQVDDIALYDMRRTIDTLSRRAGAIFSLGHSSTQGAVATGGGLRVVQAGAEVFYTPERFGFRDGRVLQFYANAFQNVSSSDEGFVTGEESRIAGIGARYKPLRDYNLVFALERRLALGDRAGEDDWLVRAGFSASYRTDWNPTRDTWTTWQLYTESAYFTHAERFIQPFDARVGRSWKLARWHGALLTPFVGIAGEYDSEQEPRTAAGVGPGLAARYWFRETRYRAFSSHVDFSLQYRFRITDASRGGGLFGLLSVSF